MTNLLRPAPHARVAGIPQLGVEECAHGVDPALPRPPATWACLLTAALCDEAQIEIDDLLRGDMT